MRSCIFCGSSTGKITKEHVIPKWMGELYQDESEYYAVLHSSKITAREYPMRPFKQEARGPCVDCNRGWMSRLEKQVKGQLGPMVKSGESTILTPRFQEILARWTVKTAYCLHLLRTEDGVLPPKESLRFYEAEQPLESHAVDIGHRSTLQNDAGKEALVESSCGTAGIFLMPPDQVEQYTKLISEGYFAYEITYAIGYVILRVRGHTFPTELPLSRSNTLSRIWPTSERLTWPSRSIRTLSEI